MKPAIQVSEVAVEKSAHSADGGRFVDPDSDGLTAIDTESEGDSVADDGDSDFAEHHDVLRDAEPVVIPIPMGRRLVLVGGVQFQHSPARTEQDSDHGYAEDFGEEDTESLPRSVSQGPWTKFRSLSPAGVRSMLLSEISMFGIKRRYSRAEHTS